MKSLSRTITKFLRLIHPENHIKPMSTVLQNVFSKTMVYDIYITRIYLLHQDVLLLNILHFLPNYT